MILNKPSINVVSLFDGISTARLALDKAGIKVGSYYASEIDDVAIAISKKNYPDIIQLGSVTEFNPKHLPIFDVDLLIGGSPCQDLSIAKKDRQGLKGNRSSLFYEYLRVLQELKPKYFILENVASMSNEDKDEISKLLGVEPIMIDASLVSPQNRKRYFWTNIPGVELPKDKGLVIRDILQNHVVREYVETKGRRKTKTGIAWDASGKGYASQQDRAYYLDGKHPTIPTARTMTKVNVVMDDDRVARLTFNEVERMQGLPDNYTDIKCSKERRGGCIGNGFNADVIAHLLSYIKEYD